MNNVAILLSQIIEFSKSKDPERTKIYINYLHLFTEAKYDFLYKSICGITAHVELDKYIYQRLTEVINILESSDF